eukprot:gene38527-10302_t
MLIGLRIARLQMGVLLFSPAAPAAAAAARDGVLRDLNALQDERAVADAAARDDGALHNAMWDRAY